MNIAIVGATGFIGHAVAKALCSRGHRVIGLSRTLPRAERKLDDVSYIGGIDIVSPLPEDLFDGVDAIVHATGIIREKRPEQTFEAVHRNGMRHVVHSASHSSSTRKLIFISAIGSDLNAKSAYSRSKAQAEQVALESGLDVVILRPSIVLGTDGEFVAQMENLVRFGGLPIHISIPVIPIPGAGRSLFQPIHIDDLAASIVNSLDFSDAPHTPKIIELGGSEQVSFEDLIKEFARRLGVKKPIFHAPLPLLFAIAPLFELLENPPITADQLRNLSHDNICDLSQMRSLLKIEPLSFYESMDKIFDSAATS